MAHTTTYHLTLPTIPNNLLDHIDNGFPHDIHQQQPGWRIQLHSSTGQGHEIAEHIRTHLHPPAPFTVREDPGETWLGTLYRYHPTTGLHHVPCDWSGTPLLTLPTFTTLTRSTTAPRQAIDLIHAHYGTHLTT